MTSVKYSFNFLAGCYLDEQIVFNNYHLTLHLYVNTYSDMDQEIGFARLDTFVAEFVDNSIFIDESIDILPNQFDTIPIITLSDPGPTDHVVLITLLTKLNAILNEKIIIYEGELSSTRGQGVKYIYALDNTDEELISSDSKKWWNDDSLKLNNNDDIYDFSKYHNWKDLDLLWEDEQAPKEDKPPNNATIIEFNKT